jgi:16S rRNA (cytosine967-C5)-methyltransferase
VRRRLSATDADTLDQLRLAAYQLLLLDRIPAYAAVDHAVEAVRRIRGPRVAGFVNAVLRKVSRARAGLGGEASGIPRAARPAAAGAQCEHGAEALPEEPLSRLAVECSIPDELARHWHEQLGLDEARQLARSLLDRAPLTVRANTLRNDRAALQRALEREGARVEAGRHVDSALQLTAVPKGPFELSSYREGLWIAQDEAAQLVSLKVDPRPGETVLDACAGVGGKSTHLGALMENRGRVVCVDTNARKLDLLREHGQRLGVTICEARAGDLRSPDILERLEADRVLVDAPCTGLGVLRRHPELKWRPGAGLSAMLELVRLQRELLSAAITVLRPGGVLVYSVCTLTEEEGPEQRRWLLERHPELSGEEEERLWPHRSGTDGFYVARFRRME